MYKLSLPRLEVTRVTNSRSDDGLVYHQQSQPDPDSSGLQSCGLQTCVRCRLLIILSSASFSTTHNRKYISSCRHWDYSGPPACRSGVRRNIALAARNFVLFPFFWSVNRLWSRRGRSVGVRSWVVTARAARVLAEQHLVGVREVAKLGRSANNCSDIAAHRCLY